MDIPYRSIFPALSNSRKEREKLVVWPRIFAAIARWLMGTFGLTAVGYLSPDNEGNGHIILTLLITAFF